MKLKSKILLGVTGIVFFIMTCSTFAVYYLLNRQNQRAVHENLEKAINIVRDDLAKRRDKQITDSANMVTTNQLGSHINFISQSADQADVARGSFLKTTEALSQTIISGGLWQAVIYDKNGELISFAQSMGDDTLMVGYADRSSPKTFTSSRIKIGDAIIDARWQTSGEFPIETIAQRLDRAMPPSATNSFVVFNNVICLQTIVPTFANEFNSQTGKLEQTLSGAMVANQPLASEFTDNISHLTQMGLGIFTADGKPSTSTVAGYDRLQIAENKKQAPSMAPENQAILCNEIKIGSDGYFQALMPLHDGTRIAGWIAALASKASVAANSHQMIGMMILVYAICLLVVMPLAYWFAVSFSRIVNNVLAGLKDIAEGEGDLTRRLDLKSRDELGELAHWFNTFIHKLQGIIKEIADNAQDVASAATELEGLSQTMRAGIQAVSSESEVVCTTSEEVSSNISSIASAMMESSTNLNTVAAAAEEMNTTFSNMVGNTATANQIASQAVEQVKSASAKVSELGKAALEIGKVTETITEISDQTNLLALNATIEAARAGEAGKGFAVVANEIKELARQTASATSDIKFRIEGIQQTTDGTIIEIDHINQIIRKVSEIVAAITSAVEEQSDTTSEIAGNVANASLGVQEVNEKVTHSSSSVEHVSQALTRVSQAAVDMSGHSIQVNESTRALSQLAEHLRELVSVFKV